MSDNPYKTFDYHIKAQEAEIARLRAKVAELEADNAALRNNKTEEALR
jgi:cell division protein FtsB